MPRPRKIDYPNRWQWKQADRAWLRPHGDNAFWPFLIALTIGLLSGSAVVLLVLIAGQWR